MENVALYPVRVHQGQIVGLRAVRLPHEVATDDVRTTAGAGHGVVPLLKGMITEEGGAEVHIAFHSPDVVGTVVDTEGDLSLHHHVDDRESGLFLHPAPKTLRWTLTRGVRALQVPKELLLVCARRALLLKDLHRLPGLTRAAGVWLWMNLIDKPCILSLGCT